ncbi:helix-turn-helix transcriptional regulator [Pseudomonas sp. UMAB-40]|uniref:helix-turn-helix domain-containing protein n=1 Tax=Pseudomonas sp. UMAB-40 TaxID=1365407 RepID=UPI001C598333|nr:helix-turn-helix transcriptional regulator [Pseudomonas sp. UMAB-40]
MSEARLTALEFKELMKAQGWSGRALAERWKKTPPWISKIVNDEDREPHWDDAVKGLPKCKAKKTKK